MRPRTISLACALLSALAGTAAPLQADIVSTFDHDTEGWISSNPAVSITQQPSGGHPGGFLRVSWNQLIGVSITAPAAFHGDLRQYDGGTISFDGILLAGSGRPFSVPFYGDVSITSSAGTAYHDLAPEYASPPAEWTTFSAPFNAATFGVTQEQWTAILSSVTDLQLGLSVWEGLEQYGIDNFTITVPGTSAAPILALAAIAPLVRRRRA